MKKCCTCKQEKPYDLFSKNKSENDKYHMRCKQCQRDEYKNNIDRYRQNSREYSKSEVGRRNYKKRIESGKHKFNQLKSKYGITADEYHALLIKQKSKCAICDKVFEDTTRATKAHVDHCHKTGRIRGLLCNGCNLVLGHFDDDVNILKKAMEYLNGV